MKGVVRSDAALGCALGLVAFAIAVLTDASAGAAYLIAFAVTSVGFAAIMHS